MEFTRPFEKLGKNDADKAGGKGASLGEMTQAGIPVPPGFVILAETFDHFLAEADLNSTIAAELAQVNVHDTNSVEQVSERIRAIFEATPIPEDIAKKIEEDFAELDAKFVAVRSSATAEDAADASWAGELESYLYTSSTTLLENVKKCWSSLFTPRAIFYRTEKGMRDLKVAVAVVVQKMVPSEISGICFTVHPVTKDPNQLIIEAGWGLGEAIVGGMITPDSYIIDKRNWEMLDTYISEQSMKVVHAPEGDTEEAVVAADDRERQKMSHERVLEMAKLAAKIEMHYGFPQDIEWALADGKIWIVQSRPITTL